MFGELREVVVLPDADFEARTVELIAGRAGAEEGFRGGDKEARGFRFAEEGAECLKAFPDTVGAAGEVDIGRGRFREKEDFRRGVREEPIGELGGLGGEGFGAARLCDKEEVEPPSFGQEGAIASRTGGLTNPVQEAGFAFVGLEGWH